MSFKRRPRRAESASATDGERSLADLRLGEPGVLGRLDLPEDLARRLMELGFLPGHSVVPARSAPGGGPRVFRVDGSEIALRQDTAARLFLHRELNCKAAVS